MNIDLSIYLKQIKVSDSSKELWDPIRKKWIIVTPEETVRQCIIMYLSQSLQYPKGRIGVERLVKFNNLSKRYDIVVFDKKAKPYILIECKAPEQTLAQSTIDQVSIYNTVLTAPYVWISNGHQNLAFYYNISDQHVTSIDELPTYNRA